MSSQSEVGISPVLLQAITQTLSNKVPTQKQQQHAVTNPRDASLSQHESVPVVGEQVS